MTSFRQVRHTTTSFTHINAPFPVKERRIGRIAQLKFYWKKLSLQVYRVWWMCSLHSSSLLIGEWHAFWNTALGAVSSHLMILANIYSSNLVAFQFTCQLWWIQWYYPVMDFYLRHLAMFLSPVIGDDSRWELCYRSSTHGTSDYTFHSNCDGKSNTVTIVKKNDFRVWRIHRYPLG